MSEEIDRGVPTEKPPEPDPDELDEGVPPPEGGADPVPPSPPIEEGEGDE